MTEESIHLGEILKKRRQERHLSLKEIENATSIRMNFLTAIEEGHVAKLISPIYAGGFIKKYASFLDLDGEALMRDHASILTAFDETASDRNEYTLGRGSVEVRGGGAKEVKWLPNMMWVGLSVIGILSIWLLARYFDVI